MTERQKDRKTERGEGEKESEIMCKGRPFYGYLRLGCIVLG